MKRILTPLACLLAANAVHAQSNVQIYGIMDINLRHTSNESATGAGKTAIGDGHLTGSRLGFQGSEDLGGGLKTIFNLESGILPDTGQQGAGGALFGRNASVGLAGDFGSIKAGRMFNTAHDMIGSYEPMAIANLGLVGFQAQYTTTRFDNMIKYNGTFDKWAVGASYAFGESPARARDNARYAVSLAYRDGPLRIGGAYQVRNTISSYFGTTVPSSDSTLWTAGGTYEIGQARLYLGYTDHRLDVAQRHNQVFYTGFRYAVDAWSYIAQVDCDRLHAPGVDGQRTTSAAMALYSLSKRTELYVEADHTTLQGGWRTLGAAAGFYTPFYGKDKRTGFELGLRHRF